MLGEVGTQHYATLRMTRCERSFRQSFSELTASTLPRGDIVRYFFADISGNIDRHQYGNRPGMSTSHYLVDLLEYLYSHADKTGYTSTVVMTDFSKACDLVDHNIAIEISWQNFWNQ